MEKSELIQKYNSTLISALNLSLDSIINIEDLDELSKARSKKIYKEIKRKIEASEDLTNVEYNLLSMVCLNSSDRLADNARLILKSAEDMKNLSKALMVDLEKEPQK